MANDIIYVTGRIRAKPGQEEAVRQVLLGMLAPTRSEKGCRRYDLMQGRQNPTDFVFLEEWESQAAIDAHMGSAHIQDARGRLQGLLAAPPDIVSYRQVG